MRHSGHAKRRVRHQQRLKKKSSLNLVSLMDIFTILVFFLLVNSSEVEVLESNKDIKLPESVAEQKPKNTVVVMVNNKDLIVQGRKVADVVDVLGSSELIIANLDKELKYLSSRRPQLSEEEQAKGRAVTILGDEKVPYQLLKRVMTTCAKADFRNISLAVNKIDEPVD
ncbi:MAG: ExbD/TolR family protein, partial [Pseudomonadales bacterium]